MQGGYWSLELHSRVTNVACTAVTRDPELGSRDGNSLLIAATGHRSCLSTAGTASLNPLRASKSFGLQGFTCLPQAELKESTTHVLRGQASKQAQTLLCLWHLQPPWLEKDGKLSGSEAFLQGCRRSSKPPAKQHQATAAVSCLLMGGQWERKVGWYHWRRGRDVAVGYKWVAGCHHSLNSQSEQWSYRYSTVTDILLSSKSYNHGYSYLIDFCR